MLKPLLHWAPDVCCLKCWPIVGPSWLSPCGECVGFLSFRELVCWSHHSTKFQVDYVFKWRPVVRPTWYFPVLSEAGFHLLKRVVMLEPPLHWAPGGQFPCVEWVGVLSLRESLCWSHHSTELQEGHECVWSALNFLGCPDIWPRLNTLGICLLNRGRILLALSNLWP